MIDGLNELLEEEAKKNKNKPGKKNTGNASNEKQNALMGMASNPIAQALIKSMPTKYKVMIMLAVSMMMVGVGTTVCGLVELIKYVTGY